MSWVDHGYQSKAGPISSAPGLHGPLYSPADVHGNFSLLQEDTRADRFDFEELELDPSERRPGGPVAQAVLGMPQRMLVRRWGIPLISILLASLLQSIGVYSSTQLYARSMLDLANYVEGFSGRVHVVRNSTGRGAISLDKFRLHDNFVEAHVGHGASSSWFWELLKGALPFFWVVVTLKTSNLRLWTHVWLVGSVLFLLKAVLVWVTVVPDPGGWNDCKAHLDMGTLLGHPSAQSSILGPLAPIFDVICIWVAAPDYLVCSDGVLSRPTFISTLFALGLYDAARMATRKMKPQFRWLYRTFFSITLASIVIMNGMSDLASGRQYTVDVALSLGLTLLLYSSPPIALCVDRWLTAGYDHSAVGDQTKDTYDQGDVTVPLCCLPFCCLHGRYFLYPASAQEAEAELKAQEMREKAASDECRRQAAIKSEEFRVTEEDVVRRLLEIEASMDYEQQRAKTRDLEDKACADARLEEAHAKAKGKLDLRIAKTLAHIEAEVHVQRQEAMRVEDEAACSMRQSSEAEADLDEQLKMLEIKARIASQAAADKKAQLVLLQEELEQQRKMAND